MERVGGDEELLREVVGLLLDDAPRQFEAIRLAIVSAEFSELKRRAHALRGAISNIAAGPVTQALTELEGAAGTRQLERVQQLWTAVDGHWKGLEKELTSWMRSPR
jgi:HPt (histidine-containing phosphotransfer) domain-containing protein